VGVSLDKSLSRKLGGGIRGGRRLPLVFESLGCIPIHCAGGEEDHRNIWGSFEEIDGPLDICPPDIITLDAPHPI
jgi:hypothetical protein